MQTALYTCKGRVYMPFGITILLLISGCGTTGSTTTSYSYASSRCSLVEGKFSKIKQQAEAGDAKAQFQLGAWYISYCIDHSEGAKWYQRAAEQGYREAQTKIARMYLYGIGVEEDIEEAEKWYRKAADRGHVAAFRSLGSMYLEGKRVTKDLDEAEKWFSLAAKRGDYVSKNYLKAIAKEKDPVAWERKQKEILAAEKEQQRLLADGKRAKKKEEIRQRAEEAKARFGLVSVSVIEEAQSKVVRAKVRRNLESLPEGIATSSGNSTVSAGDVVGVSFYTALYTGPAAPFVLAGMGLYGVMHLTYQGIKKTVKTKKEKAKVRPAIKTLIKTLAQENLEKDFIEAILATAVRQQAPNIFVSDSDDTASKASHLLKVQLKELRMIAVPTGWDTARMWATTEVALTSRKTDGPVFEKRFCYGSPPFSIEASAKDAIVFKEHLNNVYRSLSNQILSEALGLAADDNAPSTWVKTEKMCREPIKVAGGYYLGEMKDGKRHGLGEMRYRPPKDWVRVYQGQFVNGKEHGEGRCKWTSGGRDRCVFVNGTRKRYQ